MNDTFVTDYGVLDAQWDEALGVWRIYLHPNLERRDAEHELWKEFRRFARDRNLEHTIKIQRKHPNYVVAWVKNKEENK
jgi:hypothetical protein|tara:strand:- start:971 stop:1207 length:237 start_codon:yes stop_codon:yes gene_type:complete